MAILINMVFIAHVAEFQAVSQGVKSQMKLSDIKY
jgi:hypothetical protein